MKTDDAGRAVEILQQSINDGLQPFLQLTSDSMQPLLRQGDEIRITPVEISQLFAGDIIVVKDNDGLLAHRLWLIFTSKDVFYVLLRGDRLKEFDPPYPECRIIGRVITRRRNGLSLDISAGLGGRLNNLLTRIAAISRPPPTPPDDKPDLGSAVANILPPTETFQARARNKALLLAAIFLTSAVDLFNRIGSKTRV